MIGNVYEFNEKFGLPLGDTDKLSGDVDAQEYRVGFIEEELKELKIALDVGDMVGAFDALLDLVYVAQGTALFMGISPAQWAAGMHAVHCANMAKVRVANSNESKRGSVYDVRKPEGWVGPESRLAEVLKWGT